MEDEDLADRGTTEQATAAGRSTAGDSSPDDSTAAADEGATSDARRARHEARRASRDAHRERRDARRRSRREGESADEGEGDDRSARSGGRSRRTQAERTAATTERILDATVSALADLGHRATSTSEICRRAGVSRGALLHHFATKDELFAAAASHVFARGAAEFRERLDTVPAGADRVDAAIDVLWQIFRTATFDAWLELIVAGRTDPALQRHVARGTDELAAAVTEIWVDLFPTAGADRSPDSDAIPLLLFSLLEGLALNRHSGSTSIEDATPHVLSSMKAIGHLLLADSDPTTRGAP